jgi:hypothetical protein
MSTLNTTYDRPVLDGQASERDARALLGHVTGLRRGLMPRASSPSHQRAGVAWSCA